MDTARLLCVGESLPFQSPTLKRRGRCGHATARSRPRPARPSEPRLRAEPRPRSHEPPAYAAQPGLRFSPQPQPPQPAET
uniref:Uncharacterized protein n=1 Tax=Rangifer tarandus platyrhynchus TaxID=3082113 RepID=A0ACB0E9R5_RANTA|nr:unnamed protein product [Rangifer tarandus platyrhynchus]